MTAHDPEPHLDTARTVEGPRAGLLLDLRYKRCCPAAARCSCGEMLSLAAKGEPWKHAGPGE